MNKIVPLALTIGSLLILSGCAGTASDFECNATTSDTCMTIEQANEKAKRLEESSAVKPDVVALPRLAEGNFRTASPPQAPVIRAVTYQPLPVPTPTREMIVDPRPLRDGEKTAGLWIAPYIDTQDVYHQPTRVFFVVKPSVWSKPRVN